jgi:hypothetical protein
MKMSMLIYFSGIHLFCMTLTRPADMPDIAWIYWTCYHQYSTSRRYHAFWGLNHFQLEVTAICINSYCDMAQYEHKHTTSVTLPASFLYLVKKTICIVKYTTSAQLYSIIHFSTTLERYILTVVTSDSMLNLAKPIFDLFADMSWRNRRMVSGEHTSMDNTLGWSNNSILR